MDMKKAPGVKSGSLSAEYYRSIIFLFLHQRYDTLLFHKMPA